MHIRRKEGRLGMIYLFKLLKTAKAYRKAFKHAWDTDPNGDNHAIWNDLEDKEHELLEVAVKRGGR